MRENLKRARLTAGMTQQQMADKLGISLRNYKYIENGAVNGKIEMWDQLEDLFGIHQRVLRSTKQVVDGNSEKISDFNERVERGRS